MENEVDRQQLRRTVSEAARNQDASATLRLARELLRSGRPADAMFCASTFKSMKEALVNQAGCRPLKTFIVRSVTVEPILPFLTVESVLAGYVLDIEIGSYGAYMDELLTPQGDLDRSEAELVLVMLDLEEISGRLPDMCASGLGTDVENEIAESTARMAQMLRSYRGRNAGRLVVQGCVVPNDSSLGPVGDGNLRYGLVNAVKELNRQLLAICITISDCVFFDVDEVAAKYGRTRWRDARLFLSSRLPVSSGAFESYARSLVRTMSVLFRAPRKVLCTDLDNTLWGGVLGEDGAHGIVTGSAFPGNCYFEYQQYLKQLSARGILLALVSKNNEADVEEAFHIRAADLAVRLDTFVAKKIGWNEKADALRALAAELSLGLDSFVFVDDSPTECEAIRQYLPEVTVIQVPIDRPWEFVPMLADEWCFDSSAITEDDVNRTREYEAQARRDALRNITTSREDFLQSLEIVCTFISALDAPLARSVQLLAKTNQFNLTTRRHSSTQVEAFATATGGQAIAVRVRDRFGDAGVVGLALVKKQADEFLIDSLLLSCRVIGRGIETALLAFVAHQAQKMGGKWLIGEYIESKKNAPCADFYFQHGFEKIIETDRAGSIFYKLDLTRLMPKSPSWLTIEGDPTYEFTTDSTVTS